MDKFDNQKDISLYSEKPEQYWRQQQEKNALSLFKRAIVGTIAYNKFLKTHGVNTQKIRAYDDLSLLPAINKKNYFYKFKLDEISWKGNLEKYSSVVTSTSGSTGFSTYFLRNEAIDQQYSVLAEFFLKNQPRKKTLLIDCFGMGVWIGGLITYQAFRYAALRGFPLSIITPGINKTEIFHCLRDLAPQFDYIVLCGYPPFLKDVIDEAWAEKINLKKMKIRLLFAAENFSESFRDYLVKKTGAKNTFLDTLNIYGSAELGAMAFETPTTILIRRLALKTPKIMEALFGSVKVPTLAQYNPKFVIFQEDKGNILITADNIIPMVRYQIGDNGGVYWPNQIESVFLENGINLRNEAKKHGLKFTNLPFVYVYERSDFSTKLYGATIFPEHVRDALQERSLIKFVSGRFTMMTKSDRNENQYLEINIELQPQIKSNKKFEKNLEKIIIKHLFEKNAEYRNNYASIPKKVTPKIVLWNHEHPLYFKSGIKQKWVFK